MTDNIYQQAIIDEAQNPRNQGDFDGEENAKGSEIISHEESNASCGDEVTVYLKLSTDKKIIEDIRWTGRGCIVSQSSMSVFSDKVKGKKISEIKTWDKEDLLPFFEMKNVSAGREKCFTMGMKAVQKALA